MITRKWVLHMVCLAVCVTAIDVQADDGSTTQQSLTVGLGAQNAPRYSGSDKRHTQMVPIVQAQDGAFFLDSVKGVGYDLQNANGLYIENSLGYGLGRSDKDSSWRDGTDKLKGMGNIDATVNTSVALGWMATQWLTLEGRATLPLSDGQGVQYRTSVTLIALQNDSDTIALQVSGLFGDGRYMNTFYGVNDQQRVQSGYTRYRAAGGFYGVDSNLAWSHQFTPHWGSALSAGYTWLGDHAANSPIVFERNQTTVTAAVTYHF
ncbi:MipA/OmpV family protein [Acerihabitans sp. TG2]|uniref:MipA/OmpV family protein n=1 Tax=Acerihabitans sp. TG2 TaxID=3096008 RepID=UPI002B23B3CA|nr:MipA/OmpV family protein [Acerihabitans sp. TG2]MEA9390127.1 MipA/OmpV family protein [Acerihabitans sp. TG2]